MLDSTFLLAANAESNAFLIGQAIGSLIMMAVIPIAFIVSIIFAFRTKHVGWIISAVLTGIVVAWFAVLFSIGLISGIKAAAEYRGEAPADDGTIASADQTLSIIAPKGWRRLDNLHDGASLQAGNAVRNEYLIVLTDPKEDFAGTLEEHASATLESLVASLENADVMDPVSMTIDGKPAVQRELQGSVENLNIDYIHTTVEGSLGFHQILAWTLRSQRDTALPVLREAIRSFREAPTDSTPPDSE